MNDDNLDERLTQSLERQAAQVSARSHLTNAALKQASRIRARRRAGAVVASVAALAIAIPVGLQIFNDGRPNSSDFVGPTPSTSVTASVPSPDLPSPSASQSPPVAPSQSPSRTPQSNAPNPNPGPVDPEPTRKKVWEFDFDELDRGPAPKVPYVDGRTVHDGGETRRLGANDRLLAVVGAGDVVWAAESQGGAHNLTLIRPNGDRVPLAERSTAPTAAISWAGVSADGKRMAWSTSVSGTNPGEGSATVTYADAETGSVLNQGETHGPLEAVGIVGTRVVMSSYDEGTMLWNGATDKWTTWDGVHIVWGTHPESGLVSLGRPSGMFPCGAVVRISQPGDNLWRNCTYRIDTFSPEGEFGTSIHVQTDGLGPSLVRLVETRTNDVLVTLEGDSQLMTNFVWESNRTVLMSAHVDGEWAIVRCTVDRTCELATKPQKGMSDENALYPVRDDR